MDTNLNIEDFYILRENFLGEFVKKTIRMIDQVKLSK